MARSPVLQIPNAAQVTLLWSVSGNLAENVLGASHTGGVVFNQALAESLGAAIKAAFTSNLSSRMTANSTLARVGVRSLSSPNLPMFRDTGATVTGVAVGDALPPYVAECITLRTSRSGKSYRGRTYLSGWAESENDPNGRQSAASATAGVAFVQAISAAMTAAGLTLAVLSRPAYEQILQETTIIPGGTNIVRTLSHTTPKAGTFTNVSALESRATSWETQTRRVNGRGAIPSLAGSVATVNL